MSKSGKKNTYNRYRDPKFIFAATMAGILVFIFVVTLFAVPTTQTITDDPLAQPFDTPAPTEFRPPTPNPDGPNLNFANTIVQNNGWFQITAPVDYRVQTNTVDASIPQARVELRADQRLSVIDILMQFGVNYPSHEELAEQFFQDAYFISVWRDYERFTETSRSVGESIVIDFELTTDQVDYLGRQIAWLDGDWLHMIRIVTPENNPALRDALAEGLPPSMISYPTQRGSELSWRSYDDQQQGFLIRHPGWQEVSGGPGSPVILESTAPSARMLLRQFDGVSLASVDEAERFVRETLEPEAVALGAQITGTGQATDGYLVSYETRDNDGNLISGLASLLNKPTGDLAVADVQYNEPNVDLLTVSDAAEPLTIRQVIDSFMLLPGADDNVGGPVENPIASVPTLQAPNLSPDQVSTLEALREAEED
ncbi:MAG: hypothetical protein ACLFTK_09120 [Anaerolineales bacterium]